MHSGWRMRLLSKRGVARGLAGLAIVVLSFFATLGVLRIFDGRETIVQRVVVKNAARQEIRQILSHDLTHGRIADGVAFAQGTISPKYQDSKLRVHIRAYLSSDSMGTAVLAAFREGNDEPIKVITKSLTPKTEELISLFEIPRNSAPDVKLNIRLGAADERTIFMNRANSTLESIVTIVEVQNAVRQGGQDPG